MPESDLNHFTSWLEKAVSNGEVFKPGEILHTGWMHNTFFEMDDGSLAILEPDMISFPINWTVGVTQTLRHMRLHRDLVVSVLPVEDLDIPDIERDVVIADDIRKDTTEFLLERKAYDRSSSGWFVGNLNSRIDRNDPQRVHVVPLFAVAIEIPDLIMYFGLPTGTRVEIAGSSISIFRNGSKLEPAPDSFLKMILDGELD
jgi:hypothetical protein